MTLEDEIRSFRNPEKAAFLPHFFKTGPGDILLCTLSRNAHDPGRACHCNSPGRRFRPGSCVRTSEL